MKPSLYNFFVKNDDNTNTIVCFNALSFNYFNTSMEREKLLKDIIDNPDNYKDIIPSFYNKLKEGKFIIDDNINEFDIIINKYNEQVNIKNYKLVIMPTLQCNFRCWYCIQRHIKGRMNENILHRVCSHIEYMVTNQKIRSLSIEWFGGEPFLYFSEIIQPISEFAKKICEENKTPFYSSATTNGFLVTPQIVGKIKTYNFNRFQITLDGDREYHNKTRVSKKASSFDTILNNINYICSNLDCIVTIRVNYDDKNLNPERIVGQINQIISKECRNKIGFAFRRVWQVKPFKGERELLKIGSRILRDEGYIVNVDLMQQFVPCYASRKYYNTISFDGSVHKCTVKEDLHKSSLGCLSENGEIQWKIKDFEKIYYEPIFNNQQCMKCKYLPICMGPCTRRFEENGLKMPTFLCPIGMTNGLEFEDSILNYCRREH